MLHVAAEGQRELCRGQGTELDWNRAPGVLTPVQVVDIFRRKTAPAFDVALRLGAIAANRHEECEDVIGAYSSALGIAYQIRDDLADFDGTGDSNDFATLRPSVLLAIARDRASGDAREYLDNVWSGKQPADPARLAALCRELKADERAEQLLESYKEEAIRSLVPLENASLKGLLRRTIGKIFNDVEIKGWCKEHEQQQKERVNGEINDDAAHVVNGHTSQAPVPAVPIAVAG
jgi:geranylgeranyl pyrophosphate synthase